MAQNNGVLVTAAIRPNDSLDLIASAYASEIKGGLHTATSSTDRDNIMEVRREWGMMCYVIDDKKTYQLSYNYYSTTITDNLNWKEFSGSGGSGSGSEWLDSVISVLTTEPLIRSNGDRYLVGVGPTDVITGTNWSMKTGGFIAQWDSVLLVWSYTDPTNNMSIRVDNVNNVIYRYAGVYNSGGQWQIEKENQVRYISATTSNNSSYTATTTPNMTSYDIETIYIAKFLATNIGSTVSLNINGIGSVPVKKTNGQNITDLSTYELSTNHQYELIYNGSYFVLTIANGLYVKYNINSSEHILVPSETEYMLYGDLNINDGILENQGRVVIINGSLNILNSGQVLNTGTISNIYFAEINGLGVPNYYPRWHSPFMMTATSSIYDNLSSVIVTSPTFSVNSNNILLSVTSSVSSLTSGLFVDDNGLVYKQDVTSLNLVEKTYDELKSMYDVSILTPGQKYLITDFRTVHNILDDSNITGDINYGATESLILVATSENTFDKQAYSIDYPKDIIYYDITGGDNRDEAFFNSTIAINGLRGIIYYRKDTIQNVECWYDFRNVKFRRWLVSADPWVGGGVTTYNVKDVYEYNDMLYKCVITNPGIIDPSTDTSSWVKYLDKLYRYSWQSSTGDLPGNITSSTIVVSDPVDYLTFGDYYQRVYNVSIGLCDVTGGVGSYIDIRTRLNNIVFYTSDYEETCSSVKIGDNSAQSTIIGSFINNDIGSYFYRNIIITLYSSSIRNWFIGNVILGISSINRSNIISDNFSYNLISDFYSNTIEMGFSFNTTGVEFSSNTIGVGFASNIITNYFQSNKIGNYFQSNSLKSFGSNSINYIKSGNSIGDYFQYNTVGENFYGNVIGNWFWNEQTIGNSFSNNRIGNYYNGNTIGDNFQYNNIVNNFESNTVVNNFRHNNILYSPSYTNFTTASHVYATYSCDIFLNSGNNLRLKYFDVDDVITITDINS